MSQNRGLCKRIALEMWASRIHVENAWFCVRRDIIGITVCLGVQSSSEHEFELLVFEDIYHELES